MEDEDPLESYSSIVSEFILIGIDSLSHARKLLNEIAYRGEILLSLPNRWAYGEGFLSRLFAFGFEIPSHYKEPFFFSSIINNMSNTISYIHCLVVFEDITPLIKEAINSLSEDPKVILEKELDPEIYITEPTEINKTQERFYFPTVLAFKSDRVYHQAFRGLLEGLYEVLKEGTVKEIKSLEELHRYRLMRFAANIFFILNDFIRPATSTILGFDAWSMGGRKKELVFFHEKSVLSLPFAEETLLLSVFELEIETLLFLWKSLILGANVLVLAESDLKRFNIMEALSFLIFPFSAPPVKIPNFSMRMDSDSSKMIIMAGKVFLGLSSKHADLDSLIEDPYLKENYHIVDLDSSKYYPPPCEQRPSLKLHPFEENISIRIQTLRSEYLNKVLEVPLLYKGNSYEKLVNLQKDFCLALQELFFRFFEEEEQLCQIEKKFLNLKKVKHLRQHKFILKETNKLIEGFKKPKEFVRELVYEHTFLNFASELPGWGLTPSFRFKSLMGAVECKKLKLPLVNPALILKISITDIKVLEFFKKARSVGEKIGWGEKFIEFMDINIESFQEIITRKPNPDPSLLLFEKTSLLKTGPDSLLGFLRLFSGRVCLFEDKYDEKDEEILVKNLKNDISLLNFEEVIKQDLENLDQGVPGEILNILEDPSLDLTKHLFLSNKAIYLHHFAIRNGKKDLSPLLFSILLESYRYYNLFEGKFLCKVLEAKKNLDFPDYPRGLFLGLLIGDQKNRVPETDAVEIKELLESMKQINPKSNLMIMLSNRLTLLHTKQTMMDLVPNFPIICYNYLNFLKKSFRSHDFLCLLNTPSRSKMGELAKQKQIFKTLNKIKQEYRSDIKNIEEVFLQLSELTSVHNKMYSDSEKLIFALNFFNLKLIHQLLFHFLVEENHFFPSSPYQWLDFCEKLKFKLFGIDMSLLDLDISVIRQNLCIQQIFIPKLDFLTQLLSNAEKELFKKKIIPKALSFFHRNKLKEEKLINFTFFFAIRDTPIFRIFDEPGDISGALIEHTKEFFCSFKKLNNFQFFQKEKELGVPIPKELFVTYEEDFGCSKEKKVNFLKTYYDERLKNLGLSKIRLDYIPAKWDQFYLSPSYFA